MRKPAMIDLTQVLRPSNPSLDEYTCEYVLLNVFEISHIRIDANMVHMTNGNVVELTDESMKKLLDVMEESGSIVGADYQPTKKGKKNDNCSPIGFYSES